jgi:AraC-like DNA-binding protein
MDPIEAAIAAIESREPGEGFSYNKIAAIYGVSRSTLSRRHQGSQGTKETKDFNQQALNLQQECELVVYIETLTNKGLPPTREMIINFASQVAHRQLSDAWVTRFINRHSIYLISRWSTGIDSVRHQADSGYKYKLYFDLLFKKLRSMR